MIELRNLIIIIFGISLVHSSGTKFSESDVRRLETILHESAAYMKREARDEHVVICIGATKSGKSTLINYLIGNKLMAVQFARGFSTTIVRADNSSKGPEIGSGSTSKTKIPSRWVSTNLPNLILWDAPGFDDNRGAAQDITNAFYLYQLLQRVKSLKVVLVVDINDIFRDDVKPFVSVIKAVENLLGYKMENYFTSISVIFTKVPNVVNGIEVDVQYVKDILSHQFSSDNEMKLSQSTKDFVNFLVDNNDRIAFFKRPEIGLVTSAIDVNIVSTIKNSTSIEKNQLLTLSPSIAENSKLSLFLVRDMLNPKSSFNHVEIFISTLCQKKIHELADLTDNKEAETQLKALQQELILIQNKLFNATYHGNDFYKKMETLETIDDNLKKIIDDYHLLERIKLMEFVDKLLGFKESEELSFSLQRVLMSSISGVKEASSSIQVRLGEITQKKHDEEMKKKKEAYENEIKRINEENEKKKKENEETQKNYLLLASAGVLIYFLG